MIRKRCKIFCWLICRVALGCGARHRRAAMLWYVSSKKSSDTKDGRSLDSAFRRILHAIHVAEPDDTIVIVPGIYDQDLAKHIGAARADT